jgi:hypothetical protein
LWVGFGGCQFEDSVGVDFFPLLEKIEIE